jgi:hypothetical protein
MPEDELRPLSIDKAEHIDASDEVSLGLDGRYWFTPQFLQGAALRSRMAYEIEAKSDVTEAERIAHRTFVVSAIMQSAAALESEIWDVVHHGPGHQLGSGATDAAARDYLLPLAEMIDRQDTLSRYAAVLHLLGKPRLDPSAQPWQDADLLVWLRNEVVHYKSLWASELDRMKRIKALRQKPIPAPPFVPSNTVGWFPHACLSAPRAAWAVETAKGFLDVFYDRLGLQSPVEWAENSLPGSLNPHPTNESTAEQSLP